MVRVPPRVARELRAAAASHGTSMSALAGDFIATALHLDAYEEPQMALELDEAPDHPSTTVEGSSAA